VSFTFVPVQIYNQLILRIGNYTLSENYSSYPLQIMYSYFLYIYMRWLSHNNSSVLLLYVVFLVLVATFPRYHRQYLFCAFQVESHTQFCSSPADFRSYTSIELVVVVYTYNNCLQYLSLRYCHVRRIRTAGSCATKIILWTTNSNSITQFSCLARIVRTQTIGRENYRISRYS